MHVEMAMNVIRNRKWFVVSPEFYIFKILLSNVLEMKICVGYVKLD